LGDSHNGRITDQVLWRRPHPPAPPSYPHQATKEDRMGGCRARRADRSSHSLSGGDPDSLWTRAPDLCRDLRSRLEGSTTPALGDHDADRARLYRRVSRLRALLSTDLLAPSLSDHL